MADQPSIRDRASTALREAMRARDVEAVVALRTLLSEFANAEASPLPVRADAIEDAPALGSAEVERLVLSETELTEIAVRESDELGHVADDAEARGAVEDANRWRRRREVIAGVLDP